MPPLPTTPAVLGGIDLTIAIAAVATVAGFAFMAFVIYLAFHDDYRATEAALETTEE